MIFLRFFGVIFLLLPVEALDQIGIVTDSGALLPLTSGAQVTKKSGGPFEIFCGRDLNYDLCFWNWKSGHCFYYKHNNGTEINVCPFKVTIDSFGNCIASINDYRPVDHEGDWKCELKSAEIGDSSSMNITILEHTPALLQISPNTATIAVGDQLDVTCKTTNKIYPDPTNQPIIQWLGKQSDQYSQNETQINCVGEKCEISSLLHLIPESAGSLQIQCQAEQKDSFGSDIISAKESSSIEVTSKDDGGNGTLTKAAKIGISLGVILPLLLILLIFILAFCMGWCCFKKDKSKNLEVRDEPKDEELPPYYVQPVIYDQVKQKRKYDVWSPNISPRNPNKLQPSLDEMLVYKWEGYGRPYSSAGSLSSLSSFGHVDELVLSKELLALAKQSNSPSSHSIATSTEDSFSIDDEDTFNTMSTTFQYKDSWV